MAPPPLFDIRCERRSWWLIFTPWQATLRSRYDSIPPPLPQEEFGSLGRNAPVLPLILGSDLGFSVIRSPALFLLSYPRRMVQAELGPDQAKAFRLSSMEPMTEADPSSGTANPPRRRSTYNDALEVRRHSLRVFLDQMALWSVFRLNCLCLAFWTAVVEVTRLLFRETGGKYIPIPTRERALSGLLSRETARYRATSPLRRQNCCCRLSGAGRPSDVIS